MAWSHDAPWSVRILHDARRELDALHDAARYDALDTISELVDDPFPPGAVELRGHAYWYRVKFYRQQFRLVYSVSIRQKQVLIRRIRPRSTACVGL
jgi:mRNA-degrading endonuclease RelE of RelBE toxin-antitoxin system